NTNSLQIIENVPDNLATEIPQVYLLEYVIEMYLLIIFFCSFVPSLSSSVLQGFTCTTVRSLGRTQIKNLIRACRRKGTNKVPLVETQLTCMYNQIKEESDASSFSLYPPDMLLYYNYSLVPRSSCRSYFQELADADFSVFSPALIYKRSDLFINARSCLGITSTSLTEDNVSVLGNMCCMLDGTYIQNSHPSILERLKHCPDLNVEQTSAVETLLNNGDTSYGYENFFCLSKTTVTISDPAFPFDYNVNQFNNCLSVSTVKDNLDAITEKVDEEEYLRIVLHKLKEVKDQVQLLSAASRAATVEDIGSWTISKIDTLSALMDSSNGGWDPSLAKAIISKYLTVGGNKLGSAELNAIGGPNLCSLDVNTISTISSQSFR
uniref:Uncharacterized protein n=1 Tax=Oryzias melastigma TaxID=30732 RepID=A0A3B3DRP9_ORYME